MKARSSERLNEEKLMLFNCYAGENCWEYLGSQEEIIWKREGNRLLLENSNNKTKAEIFLKYNAKAEEQLKTVKKEADGNKGS